MLQPVSHCREPIASTAAGTSNVNANKSMISLGSAFRASCLQRNSAKMLRRLILVSLLVQPAFSANTDEITPGDNLIIEGIPQIPRALADDVARYREFRRARFLDWHPIRKEMLINARLGDTYQVHRIRFPGGARTQLTFYDDNVFAGRYQPTHGRYLVFSKDTGGNEQYQNYRYDFETGAVTLLTDGKARNSLGIWSRRGDRLAYTSTRRYGKDTDLYLIDPTNPKTDRLLAQLDGGGWSPLDWSPDDRRITLRQFISINETYLWLVDVGGGEKTLLTPKIGPDQVAYESAKFSKDGKGLFVITDAGSEFSRLAYLDLGTRALKFLANDLRGDVENFDLAADGTRIAFVTNEDGVGKLYLLDIPSRRVRRRSGQSKMA